MKKRLLMFILITIFMIGMSYAQSIMVTNPHSGQTWYKGNTYTITWTKIGNMSANVKIRLYQGSTKILAITDSTENDGSYDWTVPASVAAGTYIIRVKTIDNAVYDDSDNFRIQNPSSASITITSPHSGDVWYKGDTKTITWRKSGSMNSHVKIRLYQNGNRILGITDSTENDGSYDWTVPATLSDGRYTIRVKTVDNAVYDEAAVSIKNKVSGSSGRVISEASRPQNSQSNIHTEYMIRQGNINALYDFEMKDIILAVHTDRKFGELLVKFKNYKNNYNGDLDFKVEFLNRGGGVTQTFNITIRNSYFRAGEVVNMKILDSSSFAELLSYCRKIVRITIDPHNKVKETYETNNTLSKIILDKFFNFKVTITDFKLWKTYLDSTYKWKIRFKVHVKLEGSAVPARNLKVEWKLYKQTSDGSYVVNDWGSGEINVPFINKDEEKVFTVTRKYGHPDLPYSVLPHLREGRYKIITTLKAGGLEICDRRVSDNENGFSFRLH